MSQLRDAVEALVAVAERAGLPPQPARDEAMVFAAAIAEAAPRAAVDWVAAAAQPGAGGATGEVAGPELAAANAAFFDAASRGRKFRGAPTTLLSELLAGGSAAAADYARALTEVASAACSLGEPTIRVAGNAAVAAAAQLSAAQVHPARLPAGMPPAAAPQWPTPSLTPFPWLTGGPAPQTPGDAADGDAADGQTQPAGTPPPAPAEPAPPPPPAKTLEELLADLDAMIGLERVKREVHQQVAMLKIDAKRKQAGLKSPDITRHLVFVGNPGTGKTTVARMVGGIYQALGLLSKGQLVEVDRSELVAGFLGQTAIKTAETCAKAYGGVLFIDEAYALTDSGSENDFGPLVIAELIRAMTNHADKLMVIAAGYADKMQEFLDSNEGLRSRFTRAITLPSYSVDELIEITTRKAGKGGSLIADVEPLRRAYSDLAAATALDTTGRRRPALDVLGNARFADNLIGFAEEERDHRLDITGKLGPDTTAEELQTITGDDLRAAVERELHRADKEQHIELSPATGGAQ